MRWRLKRTARRVLIESDTGVTVRRDIWIRRIISRIQGRRPAVIHVEARVYALSDGSGINTRFGSWRDLVSRILRRTLDAIIAPSEALSYPFGIAVLVWATQAMKIAWRRAAGRFRPNRVNTVSAKLLIGIASRTVRIGLWTTRVADPAHCLRGTVWSKTLRIRAAVDHRQR